MGLSVEANLLRCLKKFGPRVSKSTYRGFPQKPIQRVDPRAAEPPQKKAVRARQP
jgi:hypothetical protein